ncbi:solute carrier family 35 member C2-like [Oncorhynchus tshawytscha]|uniref:solute carrier family 35 member C2-like n=1 Tax=Oncorhynchus tshawytscha TaxID=74940 RepID=UPI000D0A5A01|nr:solute carrier family 35 member C2-like [Oncorhynchus tshawytscha]
MFTFKSTQFNMKGFIMVLLVSFIGGIRWTLTQVLIQKAELGKVPSLRLLPIENSPDLELPLLRQKEDDGEETATEDNDEE